MDIDTLKQRGFFELFSGLAPDLIATRFNEEIRTDLLKRPEYKSWVRKMDVMRTVTRVLYPQGKQRGDLLMAMYHALRFLDDVADGYRPIPEGYSSAPHLVEETIEWIEQSKTGGSPETTSPVCTLLAKAFDIAEQLGIEVHDEVLFILQSVLFDARRREQRQFCSTSALEDHYYDRDIVGVQSVCLKLCGGTLEELHKYTPLGKACRICDNLKDFDSDCAANIINVPMEDAERLDISFNDLRSSSPKAQQWMREQIALCLSLLEEHRIQLATMNINPLIRAVLHFGYERPTRRFLRSMQRELAGPYIHASASTLLRTPMRTAIAATATQYLNRKHRNELDIQDSEWERYWKKSWNLSLCYNGFSVSRNPQTYYGAAKAAFLCCVYDVATDWRRFDEKYLHRFKRLLKLYASEHEQDSALELYHRDKAGRLAEDGLERGWAALEFIVDMMGIRTEFEDRGIDIRETGISLQIVDDVLDLEEDRKSKDNNCLLTPRRNQYLQRMTGTDIHRHFDPKSLLCIMIEQARLKALEMLYDDRGPRRANGSI